MKNIGFVENGCFYKFVKDHFIAINKLENDILFIYLFIISKNVSLPCLHLYFKTIFLVHMLYYNEQLLNINEVIIYFQKVN